MTKEEAKIIKQELKSYQYICKKIERLEEDRLAIETKATHITPTLSDMPKAQNMNSNKVQDCALELAEISNTYSNLIVEAERVKQKIIVAISKIEYPYNAILEQMYIRGDNLMQVALDYNWDYTYMCKQHGRALEAYAKNLNNFSKVQ